MSAGAWVFQFDRPHIVGTVCGFPCEQCGDDREMAISLHGKRVANVPMLILAPASKEEWFASIVANGGDPSRARILREPYYYRVSMD